MLEVGAMAHLGPSFRVTKSRGALVSSSLASYVSATAHPASILRAPDAADHVVRQLSGTFT